MIERFGMIGKKVGMTRVYDDQGQATAVTVMSAEPNTVYEVRTPEKNGVKAEVPLAEMFGYVNTIRSLSRGRAAYSMEPSHFEQVPSSVLAAVTQQKKG